MTGSNFISRIAIVGAGGNVGSFMTSELLKTGKHTVTAITRVDSKSTLPSGVAAKTVDYDKPETIVEALRGQHAVVITLGAQATFSGVEEKLVRAAGEAEVPWILPNEWSPDTANEEIVKDVSIFAPKVATRKLIQEIGQSSFISVVTGFWYEWSLGKAPNYGIDMINRQVTLFDEGETKICTSTWPQVGRAVAALLSLPIKSENGTGTCLENLRNKVIYINSFTVSQKDMFASVLRVTGTKQSEWSVSKKPVHQHFADGAKAMKEGNWAGAAGYLYGRIFFPDGCGDFEHSKGTMNAVLGLLKEDIDEGTRIAWGRQKDAGVGGGH